MRGILAGLILLFCSQGFAQDKQYISYLAEINYTDSFTIGDLRVEFVELITDSRCPKLVTCIWAGEAKVRVAIYQGKTFLESKELVFPALGSVDLKTNSLFNSDDIRITAVALYPYPLRPDKIPFDQYSLEIKVN
ncbi:MAG: hypothetical protein HKN00_08000 [Flavobacteriaceae bacterium]|nr:hypothetical protein [Bacteroidia bacterium]MBT8288314.1 hypothetical protein [Bacteroidia bacterium]NNF75110.1 hypothetical protein [Flavobacteriaceae bacterium]NNK73810.1 hypothetical protein [Flavobacteriaceae bacterium]